MANPSFCVSLAALCVGGLACRDSGAGARSGEASFDLLPPAAAHSWYPPPNAEAPPLTHSLAASESPFPIPAGAENSGLQKIGGYQGGPVGDEAWSGAELGETVFRVSCGGWGCSEQQARAGFDAMKQAWLRRAGELGWQTEQIPAADPTKAKSFEALAVSDPPSGSRAVLELRSGPASSFHRVHFRQGEDHVVWVVDLEVSLRFEDHPRVVAAKRRLKARAMDQPSRPTASQPVPVEEKNGLYSYRDAAGHTVIPPRFELATAFLPQGIAAVVERGSWEWIDREGRALARAFVFDNGPDDFSEGLARIVDGGRVGFMDESGRIVIAPSHPFARPFHEGRAAFCDGCASQRDADGEHSVVVGGKWGFLDRTGAAAIPASYDEVRDFAGGRARVRRGGSWEEIEATSGSRGR